MRNLEVKTSVSAAIKDIVTSRKYNLSELQMSVLYSTFKESNAVSLGEGFAFSVLKKLDEIFVQFSSEWFSSKSTVSLMDSGQDVIKSIEARRATRINLKAGTDLFPTNANVKEYIPKITQKQKTKPMATRKKSAPKKRKAPVKKRAAPKKKTQAQIALAALKIIEKNERAQLAKAKRQAKSYKRKLSKVRKTSKVRKRKPAKKK